MEARRSPCARRSSIRPYGLYRQAWAPQMMRGAAGNDERRRFGVGWYADGDPVPARYRNFGPIWADPSFADLNTG